MKYKVGFYGSFSTGHDQDKTAILEQIDTCVQKAKCEFYVTVLSDFQAWCAKQALVAPTNKLGRELKFYYNNNIYTPESELQQSMHDELMELCSRSSEEKMEDEVVVSTVAHISHINSFNGVILRGMDILITPLGTINRKKTVSYTISEVKKNNIAMCGESSG